MTKRQLIDEIISLNASAEPAFLARFDEGDLGEYLGHLQHARMPRLTGDPRRFDHYFDGCPAIAAAPVAVAVAEEEAYLADEDLPELQPVEPADEEFLPATMETESEPEPEPEPLKLWSEPAPLPNRPQWRSEAPAEPAAERDEIDLAPVAEPDADTRLEPETHTPALNLAPALPEFRPAANFAPPYAGEHHDEREGLAPPEAPVAEENERDTADEEEEAKAAWML